MIVALALVPSTESRIIRIGVLLQNPDRVASANTSLQVLNTTAGLLPPGITIEAVYRSTRQPYTTSLAEHSFTGLTAFRELAEAGVVAVIGPEWSSTSNHIAVLAQGYGIPIISPSATNPLLTTSPYFSRVVPSDSQAGAAVFSMMSAFNWTRVVVFHGDDDYGRNGWVPPSPRSRTFACARVVWGKTPLGGKTRIEHQTLARILIVPTVADTLRHSAPCPRAV
jgi:hypothetical protein